ncbi:MAG: hypothetical protein ACYTG2_11460 [Planctomycetota bacterium]|jgi:hypothetical protein
MASLPRTTRALTCRIVAPLVLGLLLLTPGCVYNRHVNMGATERWVASDLNTVSKITGTVFISIADAFIGPGTMIVDQFAFNPRYDERHKYLSFASSRTVARSDMGDGYKWMASVPALVFDIGWLIVTGPTDLVWVLVTGPNETPPSEVEAFASRATN